MSEKILEELNKLVLTLKSIPNIKSKQRLIKEMSEIKLNNDIKITKRLKKKLLNLENEPRLRIDDKKKRLRKCSKCGCLTTERICFLCGSPTV